MKVRVDIRRKEGLADPEGTVTLRALQDLGYGRVAAVHFGRTIELEVADGPEDEVREHVAEMCRRLLANPVIEDFEVHIVTGFES